MKGSMTAVILLACYAPSALAVEGPTWVCLPTLATGFAWEAGAWRSVNFNVQAKRYVLAQRDGKSQYSIAETGSESTIPCDAIGDGTILRCQYVDDFRISLLSLRYLRVYPAGYWSGADNNDDTPLIEIGKCSKI